jgi:hypothetical protein
MFKPMLDVGEKKESRSSRDNRRQRQRRDEVVYKKRELAEQQAAEAAAHESQQDATDWSPVIPDAALSNSASDADLNNRIDEIEDDMQQTFEEFQNI